MDIELTYVLQLTVHVGGEVSSTPSPFRCSAAVSPVNALMQRCSMQPLSWHRLLLGTGLSCSLCHTLKCISTCAERSY